MVWPWKATSKLIKHWFTPITNMLAKSLARTQDSQRVIISAKRSVYGTEEMDDGSRAVDFYELSELLQLSIGIEVASVMTEVREQGVVPRHVLTDRNVPDFHALHDVVRRQHYGRRSVLSLGALGDGQWQTHRNEHEKQTFSRHGRDTVDTSTNRIYLNGRGAEHVSVQNHSTTKYVTFHKR